MEYRRFHPPKNRKNELIRKVKETFNIDLEGKDIEVMENERIVYLVDKLPAFFEEQNSLYPTICGIIRLELKKGLIVIDEGAVKALSKGADLFAPGVIEYKCSESVGGTVLAVSLSNYPIALLKMLVSCEEAKGMRKGKIAKNVHCIGDEIWAICKQFGFRLEKI